MIDPCTITEIRLYDSKLLKAFKLSSRFSRLHPIYPCNTTLDITSQKHSKHNVSHFILPKSTPHCFVPRLREAVDYQKALKIHFEHESKSNFCNWSFVNDSLMGVGCCWSSWMASLKFINFTFHGVLWKFPMAQPCCLLGNGFRQDGNERRVLFIDE